MKKKIKDYTVKDVLDVEKYRVKNVKLDIDLEQVTKGTNGEIKK